MGGGGAIPQSNGIICEECVLGSVDATESGTLNVMKRIGIILQTVLWHAASDVLL